MLAVLSGYSHTMSTRVYVENGKKRVFACALDWPGWCRLGASEEQALEALVAYGPRYAVVAAEADLDFDPKVLEGFTVVERLPGSATTDFGAPDAIAAADAGRLTAAEAGKIRDLVAASWRVFDDVVARAPAALAKGPRGGGRDRDKVVEHVLGAETNYSHTIGVRRKQPAAGDRRGVEELRRAILEALVRGGGDEWGSGKRWPLRYAARRIAWHVLDHAWEIEDKGGLKPRTV